MIKTFTFKLTAVSAYVGMGMSFSAMASDTCDIGTLHESVTERWELPEMPSALEECGISGFLDFDFGISVGSLGDLFCNFANDLIGDFQQSLSVSFALDQHGLRINSPVYSYSSPSIETLAEDFVYGEDGPPDGILDRINSSVNDQRNALRGQLNYSSKPSGSSISNYQSQVAGQGLSQGSVNQAIDNLNNMPLDIPPAPQSGQAGNPNLPYPPVSEPRGSTPRSNNLTIKPQVKQENDEDAMKVLRDQLFGTQDKKDDNN